MIGKGALPHLGAAPAASLASFGSIGRQRGGGAFHFVLPAHHNRLSAQQIEADAHHLAGIVHPGDHAPHGVLLAALEPHLGTDSVSPAKVRYHVGQVSDDIAVIGATLPGLDDPIRNRDRALTTNNVNYISSRFNPVPLVWVIAVPLPESIVSEQCLICFMELAPFDTGDSGHRAKRSYVLSL
jgi:hypothetical protein